MTHILDDDWTGMREDDGKLAPLPPRLEPPDIQSIDDRQIGAVLKACAVCGQMRYFTNPASEVCGACRT